MDTFSSKGLSKEPELIDLEELKSWIIQEDEDLLVFNKPGWVVCHPSKNGPFSSLVGAAKEYLGIDKLHLVSRLDRETSGIVILAKHKKAASKFQKAFENRSVKKTYLAILVGELAAPIEVDQPLARDLESPVYVKQTVRKSNSSKNARTFFEPIVAKNGCTLAKITPHTGRKHQIRAHAQFLNHCVLGDKIYGPDAHLFLEFIETGWTEKLAQQLIFPRQALHAHQLVFEFEDGDISFEAPLLADMESFVAEME